MSGDTEGVRVNGLLGIRKAILDGDRWSRMDLLEINYVGDEDL